MTEHLVSAHFDESGNAVFNAAEPISVVPGDLITVMMESSKVGDRITTTVTESPSWWAFWRKPRQVVKPFQITAIISGR
jgi:hypothetical protein